MEERCVRSRDWSIDILKNKGRCQAFTVQPKAERPEDHSKRSTFCFDGEEESYVPERDGTEEGRKEELLDAKPQMDPLLAGVRLLMQVPFDSFNIQIQRYGENASVQARSKRSVTTFTQADEYAA